MKRSAKPNPKLYSTRSDARVWDTIVIGSGIGGMGAAAMLAHLGKAVLVLEQHGVPGGFTHAFRRHGWVWDVGVHALGETSSKALAGRLLAALTQGKLRFAPLQQDYDIFSFPDLDIAFPSSREQWTQTLKQAFPHQSREIDAYVRLVRDVVHSMRANYATRLLPRPLSAIAQRCFARRARAFGAITVRDALEKITQDPRLLAVLTAQWGYYGSPPSRASLVIQALVTRHFWYGATYPQGGSKRIAEALLEPVVQAGGQVRVRAPVAQIIVKKGRVHGVRLESGEEILARRVISAAGARVTVEHLLPNSAKQSRFGRTITRLTPACAHLCLYLGFKGDIRKAGATSANRWFYASWDIEQGLWDFTDPQAIPPGLYTSFPSLKDPQHDPGPECLHTGEVVTFVSYDLFKQWETARWQKRGGTYESLKEELTERLWRALLRHMPDLETSIAYKELSTPVTTTHFTRATRGSIYGLEPTPARQNCWALRPRTPISGLYLAGCDVGAVGVIGAFMGGLMAATAAEPTGSLALLRAALRRPPEAATSEGSPMQAAS